MIVLDSDHLTVYSYPESDKFATLLAKAQGATDQLGTTIVCVEEQWRGWLAAIRKKHDDVERQVPYYGKLMTLNTYFADWHVLPFDLRAADMFKQFRKQKIRIGSQDLKIAAIAVACDALLLSANLRDFRQVPGLRVENWLEA